MNFSGIKNYDVANGEGVRLTLFVSGCRNRCKGCFQPETWDFNYGYEFSPSIQQEIIDMLGSSYIDGLTILGGEPFEPENEAALLPFIQRVRETYPNKTIWMYSGYLFSQIRYLPTGREILKLIDVLVDGRFEQDLASPDLKFRGSSNQRIIDVQKTLKKEKIVIYEGKFHD